MCLTFLLPHTGHGENKNISNQLPDLNWVPPPDAYDWIQLKSGEWLKGRIKAMQEWDLEFDSEELDTITFDWYEIRQLRSAENFNVLLGSVKHQRKESDLLYGRITATPQELTVSRGGISTTVDRSKIQSFTRGGSLINKWTGRGSFGLTIRDGNSDQLQYNATLNLQRRTPDTRFSFDYLGNLSEVEGTKITENHRVNSAFDVWLSKRAYLIVPFGEYYNDQFQNIDYRVSIGIGLGYYLIRNLTVEWNVTAGPAYQHRKYYSVSVDGEET
jgi:hypothetical protein